MPKRPEHSSPVDKTPTRPLRVVAPAIVLGLLVAFMLDPSAVSRWANGLPDGPELAPLVSLANGMTHEAMAIDGLVGPKDPSAALAAWGARCKAWLDPPPGS